MGLVTYWLHDSYVVPHAEVTGRVVGHEVIDPTHLRVMVAITNTGNTPASANCLIQASIPQRIDAISGFEESLAEGHSKTVPLEITVTSGAADEVTAVFVNRCSASPDYPDP